MKDLDNQLNLRQHHPFARWLIILNELQSFLARLISDCDLNVPYGDTPGQKLDIFPAAKPNSPVFVFIHGGYFRALDKRQYSFLAKYFSKRFSVVLVNYDLCPKVSVESIVEQNRRALEWISLNIHRWNGDKRELHLCGHSVGAFLVASLIDSSWKPQQDFVIKNALLLSGIFNLHPLQQSYLNKSLRLSNESVESLSPTSNKVRQPNKITIAVGSDETEIFIAESKNYANYLTAQGIELKHIELKKKNHYSAVRSIPKIL